MNIHGGPGSADLTRRGRRILTALAVLAFLGGQSLNLEPGYPGVGVETPVVVTGSDIQETEWPW